MTQIMRAFSRLGKAARYLASTLVIAAGVFYVYYPPQTTSAFFDGTWPPRIWGAIMVVSGFVIVWGIRSKVLQVEQIGMLAMAVGAGLLSLGQTLVMLSEPVTWTRGGGTLILWALVSFALARYFELSSEIRSSRRALQRLEGR